MDHSFAKLKELGGRPQVKLALSLLARLGSADMLGPHMNAYGACHYPVNTSWQPRYRWEGRVGAR